MGLLQLKLSKGTKYTLVKYLTVIGSCIVSMPNGLFWYWGNLAVYCTSYFVSVRNSSSGLDGSWVFSAFVICWTLFGTISAAVVRRLGMKRTVAVGSVLFNVGMFFSYFSSQVSLLALALTLGVCCGSGTGLMDVSLLQLVIEWSDNELGKFTAMVQGSLSLGALFINQIITFYCNPANLVPDFQLGRARFFSQKSVLDKVPFTFVVVGIFSTSLHIVGFVLMKRKPQPSQEPLETTSLQDQQIEAKENLSDHAEMTMNGGKCPATDDYSDRARESKERGSDEKIKEIYVDYTIQAMLQTKSFYVLWATFFVCGMPFALIGSYYKLFGQTWIDDDHFMADLATLLSVINAVMSYIWGIFMDIFGVKNCQIAFISSMVLVLFWYYFTAMVNKWLYFVVSIIFMCVSGPVFACYTASTAIMYGKTHFSTNFGVLMTAQLCCHSVGPIVVERVINLYGWFVMFSSTGFVLMLSLFAIIVFIPSIRDT